MAEVKMPDNRLANQLTHYGSIYLESFFGNGKYRRWSNLLTQKLHLKTLDFVRKIIFRYLCVPQTD
jgi:hypothetical protein